MTKFFISFQIEILNVQLTLLTSHLESSKESCKERIQQLKTVFKLMRETPDDEVVIAAGDFNLRDSEVKSRVLKHC